jgi:hypothetical protein
MEPAVTSDDYTIRPYRPGDEQAINDAFNEVFRRRRTLGEWAWKFPPSPRERMIMIAERSGQLLAHYAALPLRLQVDGRVWPAGHVVDVFAARPDRRGLSRRSAFVSTGEAFYRHFGTEGETALFYGLPGPRHRRQGAIQLSYDEMPFQPVCYLSRRPPASSAGLRRLGYRAEPARDWEPRLDELWQRVRGDYPVAVVRDAEWALHRFAGNPAVRYHRFLVLPRVGRSPVAWVAFRTDQGLCRWLDLLWDHRHPGALELVLHLSARLAGQTGAGLEQLWLNGDRSTLEILEARGFTAGPEPNDLAMTGRKFTEEIDFARFDGRVYLTMADCDLV